MCFYFVVCLFVSSNIVLKLLKWLSSWFHRCQLLTQFNCDLEVHIFCHSGWGKKVWFSVKSSSSQCVAVWPGLNRCFFLTRKWKSFIILWGLLAVSYINVFFSYCCKISCSFTVGKKDLLSSGERTKKYWSEFRGNKKVKNILNLRTSVPHSRLLVYQ